MFKKTAIQALTATNCRVRHRHSKKSCKYLSGMGDRLWAGIPHVTKPTRSTQPCIRLGSLNRVPALIGCGKGGNVTSAGWQVILCDPIWHVSSRSSVLLVAQTAIRFLTLPYLTVSILTHSEQNTDSGHTKYLIVDCMQPP